MDIDDYQMEAIKTAAYEDGFYPIASLMVEAAELADIFIKPCLRGDAVDIDRQSVLYEAGDVLWNLANLCEDAGIRLSDVAQYNLDKLRDRQQRGVIQGSGGDR